MRKIKELLNKYRQAILYLVFGGLTTLVNFSAYWLFNKFIGENFYLLNNIFAWIIAVIFAYITNKLFVFEAKSYKVKILFKEITEFFLARLFSLIIEEFGLWFFIEILLFDRISLVLFSFEITGNMIAKIIFAIIVVILNYFFSKFIIFKKQEKQS